MLLTTVKGKSCVDLLMKPVSEVFATHLDTNLKQIGRGGGPEQIPGTISYLQILGQFLSFPLRHWAPSSVHKYSALGKFCICS
jgi:hypothetical protein